MPHHNHICRSERVDKFKLRIALTESDVKLQSIIGIYLAPRLSKLG